MVSKFEPSDIQLKVIGTLHSCFHEKFGVPRQSLMIPSARGVIRLRPDEPRFREALRGIEEFSHLWVVFLFHQSLEDPWRSTITPPRVEVSKKVGVFASRSPHRPNPIGLSVVKLERIDFDKKTGIEIEVSGVDLLDGTPVLDIKPYVPYVDSVLDAKGAWTEGEIPKFKVTYSEASLLQIDETEKRNQSILKGSFKNLLNEMLELDPRPTSQRKSTPIGPKTEGMLFAFRILDVDVKWQVKQGGVHVIELIRL